MSTTETVRAWSSASNAANATADAAITSADTQSPDTLDNNVRSIMCAVKKQEDDTGGALAAGGSANALTVTTKQVLESGQLTAGLHLKVRATADNSSATVTFAPDGLTAANIKRADGSALLVGDIKSGMMLYLDYNSGSSEWRCANIAPQVNINNLTTDSSPDIAADYIVTWDASASANKKVLLNKAGAGLVLLTSGTVAAATLDLVLTSYTGYRGLKFILTGFRPATDGAVLTVRFSTDGGSNYITTGNYHFTLYYNDDNGSALDTNTTTGTYIGLALSAAGVGSATTEGINIEVDMLNQTSTAFYTRVRFAGTYMSDAATSRVVDIMGSGAYAVAQDTDAVRFMFDTGNIAAGNYAVYGYL